MLATDCVMLLAAWITDVVCLASSTVQRANRFAFSLYATEVNTYT